MDKMQIKSAVLGMAATNCYFAINKETKETIIIDPEVTESFVRYIVHTAFYKYSEHYHNSCRYNAT